MNDWKEFSGKPPIALSELPNGTPRFYEGAWYLRQGGVLHHAPVAVGMGRAMSSTGRLDLQTAAMNRALAGVGGHIGMGALTDSGVQAAAAALYAKLLSGTVSASSDSTVLAFQNAFVGAGGTLPADSGGRSGIDGLYGPHTQAALQSVLNVGAIQPPPAAPSSIVPAGGGGGGTVVVVPTPAPGTNTTTTTTTTSNVEPWLVGAAVLAGAGLIGMAVLHKPTRGKVSRHVDHARRHVFGSERHMRTFVKRHA